jgi:hypothetical protein
MANVFLYPSINKRMKRQVLQPFRAPRSRGDMTQERVHRKDNSARFKEMERWIDKNLTGEGVGVKASEGNEASPAKTREGSKARPVKTASSATRRSPRGKDKQDREVHYVPFKKGIERESVLVEWQNMARF